MIRNWLVATAIVFFGQSLLFAGNSKVGTSGAPFLRMGAGARPTAMGQAFVGVADDVNAVYYNPAGLGFLSRPELTAMHTQWIQGLDYNFGAFAYPTDFGAFGFSAATLQSDEQRKRGLDESDQGTFDAMDAAYGVSFARNLNPTLSVGMTARWITLEIDNASAKAWSGDVGLLQRFHRVPLSVGLAVRHFGQEIEFIDEADPQPMTVDLGGSLSLLRERLKIAMNVQRPRDNDVQFGTGAEWAQDAGDNFRYALRGGYTNAGTDADGTTGLSFGAGIGYRQFNFDFAWVPFGDLGNTFRYAAHMKF